MTTCACRRVNCAKCYPDLHDLSLPVQMSETKLTNPKDFIGCEKIPFHMWPETATILGSLALLDGASKYGRSNYRAVGVRASIYYDAARRHMNKWFEGQELDPDSGLPHLAHALACIAILIEATEMGNMHDDRMLDGAYAAMMEKYTPMVAVIKERHKDKNPHHYSIKDNTDAN